MRSSRVLKNPRSPFDKLRANGSGVAIVEDFPFVLSLSKHVYAFFSSLLEALRPQKRVGQISRE